MRPDLTYVCTRCRVRMPQHEACPLCGKVLQVGRQTRLARSHRPWPVLPWKILGWIVGLLGLLAVIATPLVSLFMVGIAIADHDEAALTLAMGVVPTSIMAFAFGIGLSIGIFGGAAALVMVLVMVILRPARGFEIHPFAGNAPMVRRSRLLALFLKVERRFKPGLSEARRNKITFGLFALYVIIATPIALSASGVGWEALCTGGFGAFLWVLGWTWWLTVLSEGPSWFVGLMDPTYAKKRRAAYGPRRQWLRRDDVVSGSIVALLNDPITAPNDMESIGWHVRGHAKNHVIDDANIASFIMVTDDDERIAVVASSDVLIDLDPQDEASISGAFLKERGFGELKPNRLVMRQLQKGDRVEVSGSESEVRDPDAGYRGGMLRSLEAGNATLIVRLARD